MTGTDTSTPISSSGAGRGRDISLSQFHDSLPNIETLKGDLERMTTTASRLQTAGKVFVFIGGAFVFAAGALVITAAVFGFAGALLSNPVGWGILIGLGAAAFIGISAGGGFIAAAKTDHTAATFLKTLGISALLTVGALGAYACIGAMPFVSEWAVFLLIPGALGFGGIGGLTFAGGLATLDNHFREGRKVIAHNDELSVRKTDKDEILPPNKASELFTTKSGRLLREVEEIKLPEVKSEVSSEIIAKRFSKKKYNEAYDYIFTEYVNQKKSGNKEKQLEAAALLSILTLAIGGTWKEKRHFAERKAQTEKLLLEEICDKGVKVDPEYVHQLRRLSRFNPSGEYSCHPNEGAELLSLQIHANPKIFNNGELSEYANEGKVLETVLENEKNRKKDKIL